MLCLYLARGGRSLITFTAAHEAQVLPQALTALLGFLRARRGSERRARIEQIDGRSAGESPLLPLLLQASFARTYGGLQA